jgi:hypothetical protein
MLQYLYFKAITKVQVLFINENKKSKMKFGNVGGKPNMKERRRERNF